MPVQFPVHQTAKFKKEIKLHVASGVLSHKEGRKKRYGDKKKSKGRSVTKSRPGPFSQKAYNEILRGKSAGTGCRLLAETSTIKYVCYMEILLEQQTTLVPPPRTVLFYFFSKKKKRKGTEAWRHVTGCLTPGCLRDSVPWTTHQRLTRWLA